MALKHKTVGWIVALIVLGLSGLMVVQALLLRSSFRAKEQAFHRNVMAALGAASQRLTTREMMAIALVSDSGGNLNAASFVTVDMEYEQFQCDSLAPSRRILKAQGDTSGPMVWVEDRMIRYHVPRPQHVNLQMVDPVTGESQVIVDSFRTEGNYSVPMTGDKAELQRFVWKFVGDSSKMIMHLRDDLPDIDEPPVDDSVRVRMVMSVLRDLENAELKPVAERIDPVELDSIVTLSLGEAGIELEHVMGVMTGHDSLPIVKPTGYDDRLRASGFRSRLFPHDLFSEPADLVVYFPERAAYLYQQMVPLVLPTGLFLLVVIGCFAYTIRTILAQRRLATLMVDFINNMTHEFKTPISTVRLACEAIARDEVIGDRKRVQQFNEMILGETQRMKNQTDKILQLALLEQGDIELKEETVDVHQLIVKAVDAVSLHVEHRHGSIELELDARRYTMTADPVHLANVIHNLLDNASKYSPERPRIRVSTANDNDGLSVAVNDNGLGMHQDDCRRAFDKYFRVSHGNVHDVKGFGLGLTYVKLMVEAHDGRVMLHSRPGEGTRVEMTFPASRLAR